MALMVDIQIPNNLKAGHIKYVIDSVNTLIMERYSLKWLSLAQTTKGESGVRRSDPNQGIQGFAQHQANTGKASKKFLAPSSGSYGT